jgi:tetratricopeptide (TPR) repeat protein
LSIKLGGTRHRRSYADYKSPSRKQPPRSDPFRIVFYLLVIGGALWVYRNAPAIRKELFSQVANSPQIQTGPAATASPQPDQFAKLAGEAYKAGDVPKAIELYTEAGKYAPNSVEYHFQVARLLVFTSALQTGSQHDATLKQALDAANKVILANPERPEGYAIFGKILDWQGQPDQALAQISRALEIDKNYGLGNAYMAEALVDLQRWDQAQTAIDLARSIDPKNPDILRDYGYVLETLGDYGSAATQYQASLAIEPNQPYVELSLARANRTIGKTSAALDELFAVDTLSPKTPLVLFEIGLTYETYVGDATSALKYYDQATQADPNYAPPWIRLGTIHYAQGSYQQAIPAFEQAIKLGITDKPRIYIELGVAYANQSRCDLAIPNLQKAQSLIQPDDQESLNLIKAGLKLCPILTPSPTSSRKTPTPSPTKKP